jgi:hypothetical protein
VFSVRTELDFYSIWHVKSLRQIIAVSRKFSEEAESRFIVKCGAHWKFWLLLSFMFNKRARFGSWICFFRQE